MTSRPVSPVEATSFFGSEAEAGAILSSFVDLIAAAVAERVLARLDLTPPKSGERWRLLDVGEVGEMLGRSRRWVHGAVKERGLPFVRLDGGALAFDPDDVRAWALARRVPAAGSEALAGRWQAGRDPASDAASGNGERRAMQKAQGSA